VLVVLALLGAAPAFAHVGLFHPAMYG
jgi:hypothetical protein